MAGSRLLSQAVLVLATMILLLVSYHTMRLGRYLHTDSSFIMPPILTQEDWKRLLVSPVVTREISPKDPTKRQEDLRDRVTPSGLYHISSSNGKSNELLDSDEKIVSRKIGSLSLEKILTEFWRGVDDLSEGFPPSRELHLNILLGSESSVVSPETIRMVRQAAIQVRDGLQALHQFVPVTMSLRFIRNLNWQPFLRKSSLTNHPCSILFAGDIADPRSSFPLSLITSTGIVAADDEFLSCDYQTHLCSSITLLIYIPSPQDQPLELVDSMQKISSYCSPDFNKSIISHGFNIPSRRLGILALNDHRAKESLSGKHQNDLTVSLIDQFHSFFLTDSQSPSPVVPFDLSTLWGRRLLLARWLPLLYSDTLTRLNSLRSLHSPSDPTALHLESGSYFPLDPEKMKIVTEIGRRLDFFESCSLKHGNMSGTEVLSELHFDRQMSCLFEAIVDSNLRARGLLADPSLIDQRNEGIELISAILLPFWFPILIPVLYGSFYEIRRYYQKRKVH